MDHPPDDFLSVPAVAKQTLPKTSAVVLHYVGSVSPVKILEKSTEKDVSALFKSKLKEPSQKSCATSTQTMRRRIFLERESGKVLKEPVEETEIVKLQKSVKLRCQN